MNGTITSGNGTNQVTFTPNATGVVTLQVTETNASGCVSSVGTANIQIGNYYEADVAPRPNGSLNGTVTIADWTQAGRFVAGLDTPAEGTEFQRADCAPRATLGDGKITVADWVQAGRYAAGLDPVVSAGGFTAPVSSLETNRTEAITQLEAARILRGVNTNFKRGQIGLLQIELEAQGGENGVAFSLNFDPKLLSFVDAVLSDATTSKTAMGQNDSRHCFMSHQRKSISKFQRRRQKESLQ